MKPFIFVISLFFSIQAQQQFNDSLTTKINTYLETVDFVGLSVIVTQKNELLYQQGFGFQNLKDSIPMNPDSDIFRIASVSKLVTTLAVMQLVEKNQLHLDEDIQTYLDFRIENPFSSEITLRHLLTHTAGFEDRIRGTYTTSIKDVIPLKTYLADQMPNLIYPSGEKTLYSNYSFALAGYIVQRISGQTFFDYITQNILEPLEMSNSFVYEVEAYQKKIMSSYVKEGDRFKRDHLTLFRNLSPAGMLNASSNDMSNILMVMLKNPEKLESLGLSNTSIDEILNIHHRYSEQMPGYGLSMYEHSESGIRSMNIGGQLPSFSAQLSIVEDSIGIFIAANTAMNRPLINLVEIIQKELFEQLEDETIELSPIENHDIYSGSYRWNRYNREDVDYIRGLYANTKVLYYDDSGYFKFYGLPDKYVYVNDTLFRSMQRERYLVFDLGSDGRVIGLKGHVILDMPVYLERFKFYETGKILDNIIGVLLMLMLGIPLIWGILSLSRKLMKKQPQFDSVKTTKIAAIGVALIFIYHLFLMRNVMKKIVDYITNNLNEPNIMFHMSYILFLMLAVLIYRMIKDLMSKTISKFDQISFSVLIFIWIFYYLILVQYNLLWFNI